MTWKETAIVCFELLLLHLLYWLRKSLKSQNSLSGRPSCLHLHCDERGSMALRNVGILLYHYTDSITTQTTTTWIFNGV